MSEGKESSVIADGVSKAANLGNVEEALKKLEMDFQARQPMTEELLRESQAKEQAILDLLDSRMRQVASENSELEQQVNSLKERLDATEKERAAAEKKAEAALNEVVNAEDKVTKLLAEKGEAEKRAKTLLSEKAEVEKAAVSATRENEELRERVKFALAEKTELEKKLAGVSGSIDALNNEIASLKEELTRTAATAETAVREREQYQEKLAQFQENWEQYIASK